MKWKVLAVSMSMAMLSACGSAKMPEAAQAHAAEAGHAGTPARLGDSTGAVSSSDGFAVSAPVPEPAFHIHEVASFDEPWAMAFLPDGRLLVTEKKGKLKLHDLTSGGSIEIAGVPAVAYGGQGGFGDVALHPGFAENHVVYLSYAEPGEGDTRGAAVARATLNLENNTLDGLEVIWRQVPKVSGGGHYGHRLLFGNDGKLWISSSERQKFDPAQDMASNLGKIVRLNDDGSVPADNPFFAQGGVAAQVWSLGHRNVLGMAFDGDGRLWEVEMGPKGGDELNLVQRGSNYGYPLVSNGNHYSGLPIPDHATRPEFDAPDISWTPVISPSSLIVYDGAEFPYFQGNGFIGGLSSESLVRIQFDGEKAREIARYDMGERIRSVVQGPDGALWLLQDGENAKLLKLTR